jgi:plasmid stabilization system protein ParE
VAQEQIEGNTVGAGAAGNEVGDSGDSREPWSVDFDPAAKIEIASAIIEYEIKSEGLGARFDDAIHELVARIAERPYAYQRVTRIHFRAVMNVFPYSIIYTVSDRLRAILILNVFHGKRHPKNWRRHKPTWRE